SALQPLRPVPFEIIYVLGLGEGQFPGSSVLPGLDLRARCRCDGDILLPETNRFLLLESLLAARQKVYLLYNSRDVQNDRTLYTPPASDPRASTGAITIRLRELAQFLRCPAEAAIRRHLGLDDEEEVEQQDDEPFYTPALAGYRLRRCFLQRFVRRAASGPLD